MDLNLRAGMMGLGLFLPLAVGMAVACGSASQPPPAAEKATPLAAQIAPAQPDVQESAVKDAPEPPASQEAPEQLPAEIHITNTSPRDDASGCEPGGDLLCTDWGPRSRYWIYDEPAQNEARYIFPSPLYVRGAHRYVELPPGVKESPPGANWRNTPPGVDWQGMAEAAARRACVARGYQFDSATVEAGHIKNRSSDAMYTKASLGWFFRKIPHLIDPNSFQYQARQSRTWSGICKKTGT